MNLQASNSNTSWVISGIKYAIFKRISPSLTHQMVGPLSIALIQAGIIKRKLKIDAFDANELLENAGNVDSYIKQAVLLIKAMRSWDAPNHHIFDNGNVYNQCIRFFQSILAMKDIDLKLIESKQQFDASNYSQAFLYCWLGLLCYLEDTLERFKELHVQQIENKTILILLKEKQSNQIQTDYAENGTKKLSEELIGQQELLILCQHYAATIEIKDDSILFKW